MVGSHEIYRGNGNGEGVLGDLDKTHGGWGWGGMVEKRARGFEVVMGVVAGMYVQGLGRFGEGGGWG